MKRAKRQGSPDPIYPFGDQTPAPLPPFLNAGSGLTASGLSLSVQTADPLTLTLGGVGLKLGEGLSLVDGKLTSGDSVAVEAPLHKTGKTISLSADASLEVTTSDQLSVKTVNSLSKTDAGIGLKTPVPPLKLNDSGQLTLQTGPGLKTIGETLQVPVGVGISINNSGALESYPLAPLRWDGSSKSLILDYGPGLTIVNGKLQVIGATRAEEPETLSEEISMPSDQAEQITNFAEQLVNEEGVTFTLQAKSEHAAPFTKLSLYLYCGAALTQTFRARGSEQLISFLESHPKKRWLVNFPLGMGIVSTEKTEVLIEVSKTIPEIGSGSSFCFI
ncbi:fiber 1 [Lizard adenovirus 2]|uniref:Fiber 1 n=1 Tax=Lizard adenovirus 2 TaxID=874272 RepID=A0A076FUN0_9ADEN|nr:fiber 1 [Lizard adenovirus 2]AII22579.1 fiber 1 [Lizard adenovirus 2]